MVSKLFMEEEINTQCQISGMVSSSKVTSECLWSLIIFSNSLLTRKSAHRPQRGTCISAALQTQVASLMDCIYACLWPGPKMAMGSEHESIRFLFLFVSFPLHPKGAVGNDAPHPSFVCSRRGSEELGHLGQYKYCTNSLLALVTSSHQVHRKVTLFPYYGKITL